jgi:hypothetical protein
VISILLGSFLRKTSGKLRMNNYARYCTLKIMKIFLNDVSELVNMYIKFHHLNLSGTLDINIS